MQRYWISFWTGNYEDEGCTKPPFQIWSSGIRSRKDDDDRDELSFVAVIDTDDEAKIWPTVQKYFPDHEVRFCEPVAKDYIPTDRFPCFRNETSLE